MGCRWGQGADGARTFVRKPGTTRPSSAEHRECPGEFCNCLGYCRKGVWARKRQTAEVVKDLEAVEDDTEGRFVQSFVI